MKIIHILIIMVAGLSSIASAQTNIVPLLRDTSGAPLLTNAEYRCILGRRLTFKTESGALKGYDVTEIATVNLEALHINAAEAIATQATLDEKKKNTAETTARVLAERERQKQLAIAAAKEAAAKKAEADKIAQAKADAEWRERQLLIRQIKGPTLTPNQRRGAYSGVPIVTP